MQKKTAVALRNAAEELGVDIEVDKDYSGRGMFGDTTYAVTVSGVASLATLIAVAGRSMNSASHEDFVEDMQNLRSDNMGRDLVYY
jgi:hypothetical protein